EEIALFKIAGRRPQGVVLVSCQPSGSAARTMLERGGTQIVFLERETDNMQAFVGFDETRLAQCAVDLLPKQNIRRVTLLTGLLTHRSESIFAEQVRILLQARNIQVRTLQADAMNTLITAFASVDEELPPDIIITTALHYAQVVLDAFAFCWHDGKPNIISLSPMGLIPSGDSICHIELNWKYVANRACNMLLKEEPFECVRLPPEKHVFPTYHATALPRLTELNVLMLDEPATHALEKLLPDFTKATGIQVRFAIFPYSELFDVINHMGSSGIYDVIRMDTIWLPSSISKCLAEYDPCGNDTKSILEPMLDTVRTCFTPFDNRHCAFPFTPSVQLQFYRRDLFENVKIRRQFYESNHSNLLVPTNYDAYDTILRFFSKE
ncbi:MAG: hypothetical protein RSC68_31450, partial [Acinetobacter sp.]